jgi:hypothetical protein
MPFDRWLAAEANSFQHNVVPDEIGTANAHSVGVGFMGGDGNQMFELPDGQMGVTMGDSMVALGPGVTRSQCPIVRNSLGIFSSHDLETCDTTWHWGDRGDPTTPYGFFDDVTVEGIGFQRGTSGGVMITDDALLMWGALLRGDGAFEIWGGWMELYFNISGQPDPRIWGRVMIDMPIPHYKGAPFPNSVPKKVGDKVIFKIRHWFGRADIEQLLSCELHQMEWLHGDGRWRFELPDKYGVVRPARAHRWVDREKFIFGRSEGGIAQRDDGKWVMSAFGLFVPTVYYALADELEGPYEGLVEPYAPDDIFSFFDSKQYGYSAQLIEFGDWAGRAPNDHVYIHSTNGSNSGTSIFSDARYYWPRVYKWTAPTP